MTEFSKLFNDKLDFWTISAPLGYKITKWKDEDDIKTFNSFEIAYCPKDVDFSIYRCIENSRAEELYKQQEEVFKKEYEAKKLEEEDAKNLEL